VDVFIGELKIASCDFEFVTFNVASKILFDGDDINDSETRLLFLDFDANFAVAGESKVSELIL
jgi:hypothetical protein